MAISLSSLKARSPSLPPRILAYGTHGIGKTTLAQQAPKPVALQTEESEVNCPTFGLLKSFAEVKEALFALYTEPHDFQTVFLDSLDWLEPMVWAQTARVNKWADIETPGYGKGYMTALDTWRELLDGFNALRADRGMGVIFIAHCNVKRFDSPMSEPYDRYQIKLQERASALVQEHVDAVLFCNYHVAVSKADVGFKKTVSRGVSSGDRFLYTTERPAFLAKNRFGMPDEIPLSWPALAHFIPFYNPQAAAMPAGQE